MPPTTTRLIEGGAFRLALEVIKNAAAKAVTHNRTIAATAMTTFGFISTRRSIRSSFSMTQFMEKCARLGVLAHKGGSPKIVSKSDGIRKKRIIKTIIGPRFF